MSEIVKHVGRRIRVLRDDRGLTQAGLAEQADLAPHTVSRIERGEQAPSLDGLARIAKALRVEVADLFLREPRPRVGESALSALLAAVPDGPEELRGRVRAALRALAGEGPQAT